MGQKHVPGNVFIVSKMCHSPHSKLFLEPRLFPMSLLECSTQNLWNTSAHRARFPNNVAVLTKWTTKTALGYSWIRE